MKTGVIRLLKDTLDNADQISRDREGFIVVRRGFFYPHGLTAEGFRNNVEGKLIKARLQDKFSLHDFGEVWKAFKGGASISRQSHWWVKLLEK